MPTRDELSNSYIIFAKDNTTGKITRVAIPTDTQIGTIDNPAELQLLGRLSFNTREVTASDGDIIEMSNNDTILCVSSDSPVVSGSVRINLPPTPRDGQFHYVKDVSGFADQMPISLYPQQGYLIESGSFAAMSSSHGSISCFWRRFGWHVFSTQGTVMIDASSSIGSGGGDSGASFVVLSNSPALANERKLTAGTNISIFDGGPGGNVTISSADSFDRNPSFVVLGATSSLSNERILTAGDRISIYDSGSNNPVVVDLNINAALQPLLDGPVAAWALQGAPSTSSLWYDRTGHGHDLTTGTPYAVTDLIPGQTAVSGSNSARLQRTTIDPALQLTGSLTLTARVYFVDTGTNQHLVTVSGIFGAGNTQNTLYGLSVNSDRTVRLDWETTAGNIVAYTSTIKLPAGQWSFLTSRRSSTGDVTFDVDGQSETFASAFSLPTGGSNAFITLLNEDETPDLNWGGRAADIVLWNKALSDTAVAYQRSIAMGLLYYFVESIESSTDNAIARWSSATGRTIQNSVVTVSDAGSISLPGGQTVDGRDVSADGTTLDAIVGAPVLTLAANSTLTNERTLTTSGSTGLRLIDGGSNSSVTLSIDDGVVATVSGAAFTGPVSAFGGLTGSLQQVAAGLSYLVAGANMVITSQSNGQIVFDASTGAGGAASVSASFVVLSSDSSLTNERVLTSSAGIRIVDAGGNSTVTLSIDDGVVATVSGARFVGPVSASGGLTGSLQMLNVSSSYLVGGPGIFVATSSTGQVTISSGRWVDALDINFTVLPAFTASDGSNTIGGYSWVGNNISSGADFVGIAPGDGLRIDTNATSTDFFNGNETAPVLRLNIADVVPRWNVNDYELRLWAQMSGSQQDAQFEYCAVGFTRATFAASGRYRMFAVHKANPGYVGAGQIDWDSTEAAASLAMTPKNINVIHMTDIRTGSFYNATSTASYAGPNYAGFPDFNSLTSAGTISTNLASPPISGSRDLCIAFWAMTLNTTNAFSASLQRLKLQYRVKSQEVDTSFVPNVASYLVASASGQLVNERTLSPGSGITIVDGGPHGNLTISSTGAGNTTASYVVLASEPGLTAERTLSVSGTTGLRLTDSGANGSVTLSINDGVVATVSGTSFTGPVKAAGGLTGSLQQTAAGLSFLMAGDSICIQTQSNGQVLITSSIDAPRDAEFIVFSSNPTLSSARVITAGTNVTFDTSLPNVLIIAAVTGSGSTTSGADPFVPYLTMALTSSLPNERVLSVSGTTGLLFSDAGSNGPATLSINNAIVATVSGTVFSGPVSASAGLSGSLQQVAPGIPYLAAGSGISTQTASNGQVTVSTTAGWRIALDRNFTQDPNFGFNDGNNVWNGVTWIGENITASADSFGIVNGTGLVLDHNATNTSWYYSSDTAPKLYVPVTTLIPNFVWGESELKITAMFDTAGTTSYELGGIAVEKPFTASQAWTHKLYAGYVPGYQRYSQVLMEGSEGGGQVHPANNKITKLFLKNLTHAVYSSRSGSVLNADSNDSVFSKNDYVVHTVWWAPGTSISTSGISTFTPRLNDPADARIVIAAQSGNTNNNCVLTMQRLRIEYKL